MNGYIIQGKGKYSSNSIFLPAAGFGTGSLLAENGGSGCYWSSRIPDSSNSSEFAWRLFFKSNQHNAGFWYEYRCDGSSIRPVQTDDK